MAAIPDFIRDQHLGLAEFERLSSGETQPETTGFFSKVKEFIDGMAGAGRRSGT